MGATGGIFLNDLVLILKNEKKKVFSMKNLNLFRIQWNRGGFLLEFCVWYDSYCSVPYNPTKHFRMADLKIDKRNEAMKKPTRSKV